MLAYPPFESPTKKTPSTLEANYNDTVENPFLKTYQRHK
jgi:hypothetical protein